MKWLFLVLLVSGCAQDVPLRSGYVAPTRLEHSERVDRIVVQSGNIYIIKGRSK